MRGIGAARIWLCACCLAVLFSGGSLKGGGVTLITHGFNGNVTDWVIPMGEAMLSHPGFQGSDLSCYEMEVNSAGISMFHLAGPPWDEVESGEIVVKLDWSSRAGLFQATSTEIATLAANALVDATLITSDGGKALAELPLHLIGHSRGGSVVSEIARLLGEKGIWVDQVTALDPVPVGIFGDATVRAWENVLYMESYWQEIGGLFVPTGQPIAGAYNRQLTSLGGGYGSAHSDAHLWYHGTIDPATPVTDTQATIGSTQRAQWWTAAEVEGAETGFLYSRIGAGDRTSKAQPGGAPNAVRDGLNQTYDFGVVGTGNRQLLSSKSDVWPNLIIARRTGTGPIEAGGPIELQVYHQDGASAQDPALTISLDPDGNPWNCNEVELETLALPGAGAFAVASPTVSASSSGIPVGSYGVLMTLSQGGKERHFHAADLVEITAVPVDVAIVPGSAGFVGGAFGFEVTGVEGSTVSIEASEDMMSWQVIATQVLGPTPWVFSDPSTSQLENRFYRVVE